MKKYFVVTWGTGGGVQEITHYEEMIELVRKHYEMYERHPIVFYGEKLDFEPAEVVKSWKIKEPPRS
jgi:hypothetical protein